MAKCTIATEGTYTLKALSLGVKMFRAVAVSVLLDCIIKGLASWIQSSKSPNLSQFLFDIVSPKIQYMFQIYMVIVDDRVEYWSETMKSYIVVIIHSRQTVAVRWQLRQTILNMLGMNRAQYGG